MAERITLGYQRSRMIFAIPYSTVCTSFREKCKILLVTYAIGALEMFSCSICMVRILISLAGYERFYICPNSFNYIHGFSKNTSIIFSKKYVYF